MNYLCHPSPVVPLVTDCVGVEVVVAYPMDIGDSDIYYQSFSFGLALSVCPHRLRLSEIKKNMHPVLVGSGCILLSLLAKGRKAVTTLNQYG